MQSRPNASPGNLFTDLYTGLACSKLPREGPGLFIFAGYRISCSFAGYPVFWWFGYLVHLPDIRFFCRLSCSFAGYTVLLSAILFNYRISSFFVGYLVHLPDIRFFCRLSCSFAGYPVLLQDIRFFYRISVKTVWYPIKICRPDIRIACQTCAELTVSCLCLTASLLVDWHVSCNNLMKCSTVHL